MGRDSKFTPEKAAIILQIIEEGHFIKTAIGQVGIGTTTFHRWMERGKSSRPEDKEYRAFRQAVRRARSTAEMNLANDIRKDRTWQAKAWVLERSFRKRWGQKVEVTGKNGSALFSEMAQQHFLSDDTALELAAELDARLAIEGHHAGRNGHAGKPGPLGLPAAPGSAES